MAAPLRPVAVAERAAVLRDVRPGAAGAARTPSTSSTTSSSRGSSRSRRCAAQQGVPPDSARAQARLDLAIDTRPAPRSPRDRRPRRSRRGRRAIRSRSSKPGVAQPAPRRPTSRGAPDGHARPRCRVLLVSGSLRRRSTNTAALRTAAGRCTEDVTTAVYDNAAKLPQFNPDDDVIPLHPAVADCVRRSGEQMRCCSRPPSTQEAFRARSRTSSIGRSATTTFGRSTNKTTEPVDAKPSRRRPRIRSGLATGCATSSRSSEDITHDARDDRPAAQRDGCVHTRLPAPDLASLCALMPSTFTSSTLPNGADARGAEPYRSLNSAARIVGNLQLSA